MAYNIIAFHHLVRLCFLLVFHDCANTVHYFTKPSVANTSIKYSKETHFLSLFLTCVAKQLFYVWAPHF